MKFSAQTSFLSVGTPSCHVAAISIDTIFDSETDSNPGPARQGMVGNIESIILYSTEECPQCS